MSARPAFAIPADPAACQSLALSMLAAYRYRTRVEILAEMTAKFRRDQPRATAEQFENWRAQTMKEIGL